MEAGRSHEKKKAMAKRQNGRCFYCTLRLPHSDMTWEHLVARAHGGSNKSNNLRVAHQKCNGLVADIPVQIKLRLHDIGQAYGSDAFFLTAERVMKLGPGILASVGVRKRPRRMKPSEWDKSHPDLQYAFAEGQRIAREIKQRDLKMEKYLQEIEDIKIWAANDHVKKAA